jgi:hypothetical protein
MAKSPKEYIRLRGKWRGPSSYHKLYLGTDHLLSVTTNYRSEDYNRFYYQDIQALISRKTKAGLAQNIIYGFFFLTFLIPLYWLSEGGAIFFSLMAGSFLLLLLINWLRGPTCITYIMTPVQTMRLNSLSRIKILNKVMMQLKPMIEGIQGNLSKEELSESYREDEPQATHSSALLPSLKHESGRFHKLLFTFLLIIAILIFIDIFHQNILFSFLSMTINMALTILLIISLVKQAGSDLYKPVKIISWSTIPYVSLGFIVSYIIYIYVAIKNPTVGNNQWELIKLVSALSPKDHPLLMGYSIFSLVFSLMLGIPGLMLTLRFQKAYQTAIRERIANIPLIPESAYE